MIKKIDYPANGLLTLRGSKWYKDVHRSLTLGWVISFIQKTESCDRHNANACHRKAVFYGYETLGPRVYAIHRCPTHGNIRVRLNKADPKILRHNSKS